MPAVSKDTADRLEGLATAEGEIVASLLEMRGLPRVVAAGPELMLGLGLELGPEVTGVEGAG